MGIALESMFGVWNTGNAQSCGEVRSRMATPEEFAELDAKLGPVKKVKGKGAVKLYEQLKRHADKMRKKQGEKEGQRMNKMLPGDWLMLITCIVLGVFVVLFAEG